MHKASTPYRIFSALTGLLLAFPAPLRAGVTPVSETPSRPALTAPAAPTSLPILADFETGGVGSWFADGDWGASTLLTKTMVLTNTLAAMNAQTNTVMKLEYNVAGWGVVGKDTIPAQDWSVADGLSFWFYGSGNNTVFKIVLTDNGGERLATKFTDNFTGWRELTFPWQVFYHDPDYQPGGAPNDGPTLTAVEAFGFMPGSASYMAT
jgi:hypothetical protein